MLVQHILASKPVRAVVTISPDKTVQDAIAILSEKRIGALVVSRSGTDVAGIISERDVVRELGHRGTSSLNDSIGTAMTSDVVSCSQTDTAVGVLEKMTNGRFRHMPVLEGGKLVGVISIGDVVKARIDEIEQENTALTDMIAGAV